jgi:hypothetical protein
MSLIDHTSTTGSRARLRSFECKWIVIGEVHDGQIASQTQMRKGETADARRAFLKMCGRFALVTPPMITLLLAGAGNPAVASSGTSGGSLSSGAPSEGTDVGPGDTIYVPGFGTRTVPPPPYPTHGSSSGQ